MPRSFQYLILGKALAGKTASQTIREIYITKTIRDIGSNNRSIGVGKFNNNSFILKDFFVVQLSFDIVLTPYPNTSKGGAIFYGGLS
jgi:hypothetical protein